MKNTNGQTAIRAKIRWGIVGIFALLIAGTAFILPAQANKVIDGVNNAVHLGLPRIPVKPFSLGLDLQGGAQLIYQADVKQVDVPNRAEAVEGVRDVIERRVNGLGVSEPNVQTSKVNEDFRILVELPGITDVNQAIKMIGETPILEFREQNNEPPRSLTPEEKKDLDTFNSEAKKRADEALKKVKTGTSFEEAVKTYSDEEESKNNGGYLGYVSKTTDADLHGWAATQKENDIGKDLVTSVEGWNILKRGKERVSENEVEAKHILICYLGAKSCDASITKDEAQKKAQEIFSQANAENFGTLAKEHSTDPSGKTNGGDLGVFGRGMMVKAFEDAVFAAEAGQIIGPVETEFGYHIIYKVGVPKEYEVWRILAKTKVEGDILPPPEPWKQTGLSGKQLERAEVVTDPQTGAVQVSLQFNEEGKELFKNLTEKHIGEPIAIYLDGEAISIPTVQTAIRDGQAVITGSGSVAEARLLTTRLNAGALPIPVELISQQTIGATLGAESLEKSLKAGIAALILVVIFMILYYRLPGAISAIALSVYIVLTLLVFKVFGFTLTLSGIAGLILSIALAVDGNVLIFERLKEELADGKSLKAAVEEGFLRAWPSIRDGNLSIVFTCLILIWTGTSFVKGFALTLLVGMIISVFSAITVTRLFLRFVVPWFKEKGNALFLGARRNP